MVGAGFIGLELAENLVRRGVATTLVELQDQVLPPLDREMTAPIAAALRAQGVESPAGRVGRGLRAGWRRGWRSCSSRASGSPAELVVLGIGVRPESRLAVDAGLAVGPRGGIQVDEQMRTSDPRIYAVGDAVEVRDFVTGDRRRCRWPARPTARAGSPPTTSSAATAATAARQGTAIVARLRPDRRRDRADPRRC